MSWKQHPKDEVALAREKKEAKKKKEAEKKAFKEILEEAKKLDW